MRVRVLPYKRGSNSARVLSRALGALRVNLVRTRFRPRRDDVIINWGSTAWPFDPYPCRVLNHPANVMTASDKLRTYEQLYEAGVPHPQYTTYPDVARGWLFDEEVPVVARHLLRASGGRGMRLWQPEEYDAFINAPRARLYTQYVKKRDEYRVHVMNAQVIDVQQKRRRNGYDGHNNQIRNHDNGWVYCREELSVPDCVIAAGLRAVKAVGLTFGAADVGYNAHYDTACVYEVNSAPGLEGTTLALYVQGIRRMY